MLEAAHILLATGSEPVDLPFLPFDGKSIVSSTEALCFDTVPEHLIVVGGGYIGLELGSVWKRLGAKVTVIEFLPRILPMTDGEIGELLHKSLAKQGLEFHLETKVTGAKVEGGPGDRHAPRRRTARRSSVECDRVLVAVGRRPTPRGWAWTRSASTVDARTGKVAVDEHFQTNVPRIYAIGDLIDGPDAGAQGRGRGRRLRRAAWRARRGTSTTTRSRA